MEETVVIEIINFEEKNNGEAEYVENYRDMEINGVRDSSPAAAAVGIRGLPAGAGPPRRTFSQRLLTNGRHLVGRLTATIGRGRLKYRKRDGDGDGVHVRFTRDDLSTFVEEVVGATLDRLEVVRPALRLRRRDSSSFVDETSTPPGQTEESYLVYGGHDDSEDDKDEYRQETSRDDSPGVESSQNLVVEEGCRSLIDRVVRLQLQVETVAVQLVDLQVQSGRALPLPNFDVTWCCWNYVAAVRTVQAIEILVTSQRSER